MMEESFASKRSKDRPEDVETEMGQSHIRTFLYDVRSENHLICKEIVRSTSPFVNEVAPCHLYDTVFTS